MSLSGTDGFSAGTPDKRSSQPFGNNPRRDHVNNNPHQPQRTFTEGRSDDTTSARTNTSDESFAEYHHSAAKKEDGPICIVANGFNFSDDDIEVSRAHCIVNSGCTCFRLQDVFLINLTYSP